MPPVAVEMLRKRENYLLPATIEIAIDVVELPEVNGASRDSPC